MGHEAVTSANPIDLDEWRAKASVGEVPPEGVLRKQYVARVKAEDGPDSRKVSITISTKALDRMGDTIDPLGIDLANYEKNPVVLWAHAHHLPPIARSVSLKANSKALRSVAEFMPEDLSAFADSVYRMVRGGWLNAASIGFVPLKGGYDYDPERGGFDFRKTELLEYSIVPVPANPQALVNAKRAGVPMGPLKEWAEEILDGIAGPGMWVPKEQALAVFKALAAPATQVTAPVPTKPASGAPSPEQKAAPASAPVLLVQKEPLYLVDPNAVQAAVQAAVSEAVRAQFNYARGRLD